MFDTLLRGLFWLALLFVSYNAFAPPDRVAAPALSDTVLHAVAFIGLTGLLLAAYPRWSHWMSAIALLIYGASIEVVQSQLPLRSAEWKDVAMDLVGIVMGLACYRAFGEQWLHQVRAWWSGSHG